MAGEDEDLEILFWWMDADPERRTDDELDTDVEPAAPRRRRLPWPGRRRRTA